MEFNDDIIACAGLVERGDPDRFRTVMAAPLAARPVMFTLYALNVEVARAPWVTKEAMMIQLIQRAPWKMKESYSCRTRNSLKEKRNVTPPKF